MDRKREEHLIRAARKDTEAFAEIFREYYPKILRYVIYRTANAEAARDITAEAFFKAFRNLKKYRFGSFTFSAWIYKIAGNETIDYFRKKKYEPMEINDSLKANGMIRFNERQDLNDEVESMQKQVENNAEFLDLHMKLKKLPIKYQEAVILRYLEEKSISEISLIFGKKEGTVKSLISRGIAMLRKMMQPEGRVNVVIGEDKEKGAVNENG